MQQMRRTDRGNERLCLRRNKQIGSVPFDPNTPFALAGSIDRMNVAIFRLQPA
jgi:hypothetical protein